jgi:hypothetical protein
MAMRRHALRIVIEAQAVGHRKATFELELHTGKPLLAFNSKASAKSMRAGQAMGLLVRKAAVFAAVLRAVPPVCLSNPDRPAPSG